MLASKWYFFLNILMSFNLWNFAFNELCDLKDLNKLISGSCPTTIIQSYIYIYEHDLHKMHYGLHIFLLIYFAIYNYLLFFKTNHIWFQNHFIHMCVHPIFFFTVLKNWKNKDTLLKTTRRCVGCVFFRNFLMCIFYLVDFSLSCFEVVVWFSKCKF